MKGIDTNILVRYLVQDEPIQSAKAIDFIESEAHDEEAALFINGVILCELVWVLESAYDFPRQSIAKVLEQILKTKQFHIHEPDLLWLSLNGYKKNSADFADHYIAHLNHSNGCQYTVTFDKKAAKVNYFKQL